MADLRAAAVPHRAAVLVRAAVPAGLAVLLRPLGDDARPRAGVRAARPPVRLHAGQRPAPGPVARAGGHGAELLPAGTCARCSVPVSASGVATGRPDQRHRRRHRAAAGAGRTCWSRSWPGRCGRTRPSRGSGSPSTAGRCSSPSEPEFSVEHGHEYAPYVAGSSTLLYGLQDGLMVGGSPQNLEPVTGPFGQPGYSLRTVVARPAGRAGRRRLDRRRARCAVAPVKDSGEPTQRTLIATGRGPAAPGLGLQRPAVGGGPPEAPARSSTTCARGRQDAAARRARHQRRGREGLPRLPRRLPPDRGGPRRTPRTTRSW